MTSHTSPRRRQRGVTLIELCIVAAVLAVVAATALPGLQTLIDGRRLGGTAGQLGADLQLVRVEAIARNEPLRLTLSQTPSGSCYLLHTGDAADCRCDDGGVARCHGLGTALKTTLVPLADRVAISANVRSLLFDPLHGTVTPTATLRVLGADGREIRHVVNVLGRVRSCTPDGKVAGYRPC